jgi:type 1 glutamine amidotransferase
VLSRYAFDDLSHYRAGAPRVGLNRPRWLTPAQEQKFENYVNEGGRLLLHHDGIGFYPRDGAISRLAKAFFIKHPPIVEIEISPTGKLPELTKGVAPFKVTDEEFQVEMDEAQTTVFLESHSPEHGRAVQGWAHPYGQGKVVVLIPGHDRRVLEHPMTRRCLENAFDWLSK